MEEAKRRTPLRILAGVCFAAYAVNAVVVLGGNIADIEGLYLLRYLMRPMELLNLLLSVIGGPVGLFIRLLPVIGSVLAAIGLFAQKKGLLGAGALAIAVGSLAAALLIIGGLLDFLRYGFYDYESVVYALLSILDMSAFIIVAVACFTRSANRALPVIACVLWVVGWVVPVVAYEVPISPASIIMTVALGLLIAAWPLPGKPAAATPAASRAAKAATPAMTATELAQYGKLYQDGALTAEEFGAIRKRYLDS